LEQGRFSSNINQLTGEPSSLVVKKSGEVPRVSPIWVKAGSDISTLPIIDFAYQSNIEFLDKDYVADNTFYCYGGNGFIYRSTDGGDKLASQK
jgi:hypothetical protein